MKPSVRIVLMFFAIVLVTVPTSAHAARAKPVRSAEFIAKLKTGQWIRLEAHTQRNGSIVCAELRQLTGDFHNDDWSLEGRMENFDVETGRFTIGPIRVHLVEHAVLEGPQGRLGSTSHLKTGMIVDVEGTYVKDGTFLASELDDETEELKNVRGVEHRIELVGKIERIDGARRKVIVMGTGFLVTDETRLKSVIR